MKNALVYLFLVAASCATMAQANHVPVIPKPMHVQYNKGQFVLKPGTKLFLSDPSLTGDVPVINALLVSLQHKPFVLSTDQRSAAIQASFVANTTEGSYTLSIQPDKVIIRGDRAGVFYAFQSLLQMIDAAEHQKEGVVGLPCVEINDAPGFAWRGMHLDVCRHFFPATFIKKYIDLLALHKMNTFHWHLTDDQGWRIEIKKYPELTTVGAWRKGTMVGPYNDQRYDTIRYGGFYTQQEIKDVVAYAAARHITIVPEIEMPGHAQAAIAAYPWLSCTGQKIDVAMGWGVFDDVFCPKEETFTFLDSVLSEVMDLFPGKYIHIGGDECPKTRWKACAHCQQLIKDNQLKDEHGLQSYFIRRIETFVNARGRSIIGWDEILEGGLAPNAAVMSWRGTEGGIEAAGQSHYVVMSPGRPCYFDHYQAKDKSKEPLAIGGYNPLDSVYAYSPLPSGLTEAQQHYIMGAQGNVWTEYILNEKGVEYMALPRMAALAEVLWTPPAQKDYKDFISRLKVHAGTLDKLKVNYCRQFLNDN